MKIQTSKSKLQGNFKLQTQSILTGVLLGIAVLLAMLAPRAEAVDFPQWVTVTNVPAATLLTANNQTKAATTSTPIFIPPDRDLAIEVSQSTTNVTSTTNTVVGFDVTGDSFTYTTDQPLKVVQALNGTTNAIVRSIISRTNLVGVTALRWDTTSTTNTSPVTINYVKVIYLKQ